MKLVIGADLHIHPHTEFDTFSPYSDRLGDGLRALLWLGDVAQKEKADALVIAGDLLHRRHQLGVRYYDAVYDVLQEMGKAGPVVYLLAGNHDQSTYWDTALRPFSSLPGVKVIEAPSREWIGDEWVDFMPYREDTQDIEDSFETFCLDSNGPARFLITHLPVVGAKHLSFEVSPKEQLEVEEYPSDYELIISGHYHMPQWVGSRWVYVGSPLQIDRSDMGQVKGAFVLEANPGGHSYQWVENDTSPKFMELLINESGWHFEGDPKGNFVDVTYPHGWDREEVQGKVEELGPRAYVLRVDPDTLPSNLEQRESDVSLIPDPEAYFTGYCDAHEVEGRRREVGEELLRDTIREEAER